MEVGVGIMSGRVLQKISIFFCSEDEVREGAVYARGPAFHVVGGGTGVEGRDFIVRRR